MRFIAFVSAFAARKRDAPGPRDAAVRIAAKEIATEHGDRPHHEDKETTVEFVEKTSIPRKRRKIRQPGSEQQEAAPSEPTGKQDSSSRIGVDASETLNLRTEIDINGKLGQDSINGSISDSDLWSSHYDEQSESEDAKAASQTRAAFSPLSQLSSDARASIRQDARSWNVALYDYDRLAILGEYDIWVREGAVSIHGAILHASPHTYRVYAPTTHPIPIITAIRNPYDARKCTTQLSIITCRSGIRSLKNLSPKFRHIWNRPTKDKSEPRKTPRYSFTVLDSSCTDHHDRALLPLVSSPGLSSFLAGIRETSPLERRTILVHGSKGTGKSTACRHIVNALISAQRKDLTSRDKPPDVLFLDLDPGQQEFIPSGHISLIKISAPIFGPPFTHPINRSGSTASLQNCHAIGAISPRDDPEHYLRCAKHLVNEARTLQNSGEAANIVINTCGWTQGVGAQLLEQIISESRATDIVCMDFDDQSDGSRITFPFTDALEARVHHAFIPSIQPCPLSAADLRMMQTMSYFHLTPTPMSETRWESACLLQGPPLVVPFDGDLQAISAIAIPGDVQNEQLLPRMLEGTVVSIIVVEAGELLVEMGEDEPQHEEACDENRPSPLETTKSLKIRRSVDALPFFAAESHQIPQVPVSSSSCIGAALVHKVDLQRKWILLYIPVPMTYLQEVWKSSKKIVLLRGKTDPPGWAYTELHESQRSMNRLATKYNVKSSDPDKDTGTVSAALSKTSVSISSPFDTSKDEMKDRKNDLPDLPDLQWLLDQPWIQITKNNARGSSQARRIRRNIRYKSTG